MKGIPPEIDALMWQIAENGNPVAQAEFEARHARFGPELTRRIRMVGELRQAGKAVVHRPTFTPRPARVAPAPKWAIGAAAGLAVVAIAAVVFVSTTSGPKPSPRVQPNPVIKWSPKVAPPAPNPEVPNPTPIEEPPIPIKEPKPEVVKDYSKPRDVRIEDTQLIAAITLVAQGSGLQVTVAPGFKDQRVSLDYRGLSALDILQAMGEQYGFTVFQESEGHLLVVPARSDEDSPRRVGA
ncbi:hypothetical protein EON82_09120 [bacterium]|nr:MAG: hypothetical protein EON82_09120 [bacterium]